MLIRVVQLINQILDHLPAKNLLLISHTCTRLHEVILEQILARTRRALSEGLHHLIFESFAEDDKNSTPYWHCNYLGSWDDGTPRKSNNVLGAMENLSLEEDEDTLPNSTEDIRRLSAYYSYFTPVSDSAFDGEKDRREPYITIKVNSGEPEKVRLQANLVTANVDKKRFFGAVGVFEQTKNLWMVKLDRLAARKGSEVMSLDKRNNVKVKYTVRRMDQGIVLRKVDEEEDERGVFELRFEELMIRTGVLLLVLEEGRSQASYALGRPLLCS